ncbi:MAG: DUF2190 family protein [Candidatus Bathyarchaeia archaeon]
MADLYPDVDVGDAVTSMAETEILSFTAAADIAKGDPVYFTADLTVSPATSAQDCIGIALKSAKAGEQVPVCVKGVVKVVAGGAITRGKAVYGADSSRRVLALADINEGGTATHSWTRKLGLALQSFSAAGDTGLIYVCK